jgi:hypothetical protein
LPLEPEKRLLPPSLPPLGSQQTLGALQEPLPTASEIILALHLIPLRELRPRLRSQPG